MNPLALELRSSPGEAPTAFLVLPLQFDDDCFGETYGAEVTAIWQLLDPWHVRVNCTFIRMQVHTKGAVALLEEALEGNSPQQQVSIWYICKRNPREVRFNQTVQGAGRGHPLFLALLTLATPV